MDWWQHEQISWLSLKHRFQGQVTWTVCMESFINGQASSNRNMRKSSFKDEYGAGPHAGFWRIFRIRFTSRFSLEVHTINMVAYAFCLFWLLLLVLSPLAFPANTVDFGQNGSTGIMDNTQFLEGIDNTFVKTAYSSGDSMCHQNSSRSYFINGNQMPYCARDLGIFGGMVIGLAIAVFLRYDIEFWWLALCIVPIGLDGGLQLVTSYESTNMLRLITGSMAGLVTGLALGFIIRELTPIRPPNTSGDLQSDKELEEPEELHSDEELEGPGELRFDEEAE